MLGAVGRASVPAILKILHSSFQSPPWGSNLLAQAALKSSGPITQGCEDGGAAVPGRPLLAGTEARPTRDFSSFRVTQGLMSYCLGTSL